MTNRVDQLPNVLAVSDSSRDHPALSECDRVCHSLLARHYRGQTELVTAALSVHSAASRLCAWGCPMTDLYPGEQHWWLISHRDTALAGSLNLRQKEILGGNLILLEKQLSLKDSV